MKRLVLAFASLSLLSSSATPRLFVSNHDNEIVDRKVVREYCGLKDTVIDLKGETVLVDEPAIAIHIRDCENLTIRNARVDWKRSVLSEGTIESIEKGETVVRFDLEKYPLSVENGTCYIVGPGGRHDKLLTAWFLERGTYAPIYHARETFFGSIKAQDLGAGRIAFLYNAAKNRVQVGDVMALRPVGRPYPAIFIENSKNVTLEDVVVHDAFGMALIAQMSENITWRGTKRAADRTAGVFPRSGAHVSAQADASHFSNVAGQVLVENCWFDGMMDDAINVHSTCLQITNFVGQTGFRCVFRHPQATGFEVFHKGNKVRFIRGRTNEDGEEAQVASVHRLNDTELEVELTDKLPASVRVGDTVENADYQCAAIFRNNIVRNNRARGCLFTTPKKVVCTGNRFERSTGPAVVISSDAFYWFESGRCRDVEIANNVVSNCLAAGYGAHGSAYALFSIDPKIHDIGAQTDYTHKHISIHDNLIYASDVSLLYAKSVDGLEWRDNRVIQNNDMPAWKRPLFVTERCHAVQIDHHDRRVVRLFEPDTWNKIDGADGGANPNDPFTSCRAVSYERGEKSFKCRLPDPATGRRQFVKCQGVSIKAIVKVNGQEVGRHRGAFTAFAFDITKYLKPTGNELEIIADNSLDENIAPIVGDFTMYGGIYREVEFIETDPVCIDLVTDGADGVEIDANPQTGEVTAKISVLGGEHEVQRFTVPNFQLWSPENPVTYEHEFAISQHGSRDAVKVRFGFRDIRFDDSGFYLNGQKRKLRGVCRHQDREFKGWGVTREDEFADVAIMKKMGADAVRTSHYPQSRHFLDACDQGGMMVWCEVPFVNLLRTNETFVANMRDQVREMIAQRRNHPSVVMWGLFNELYSLRSADMPPRGTFEVILKEMNEYMHLLDPSRKTVCASNQYGRRAELHHVTDFTGFNIYPGWYDVRPYYHRRLDRDCRMTKDLVNYLLATNQLSSLGVSEYGAGGSIYRHNDPFVVTSYNDHDDAEEYQAAYHYCTYPALRDDERVWGTFVWQMFDSGSDLQHEPGRFGCNTKGLVEFDHQTPKDAYYFYKANWNPEPMLHLVGKRRTTTTNETTTVMGFCNAGDVTLKVNGKLVGTKTPDAAHTVIWDAIALAQGENVIELDCGEMKERGVLTRPTLPKYDDAFLFFNIVPPRVDHEEEIAQRMLEYVEKTGNPYVLYSLTLHPEGYPAWTKVDRMVKSYRKFAKALEGTKAKPAILLQAIVGHWPRVDDKIEPWQRTIDINGKVFRFCVLDERYQDYIRKVGAALAAEKPAFILGDDDIRAFAPEAECFCPLHVQEFNRRMGTNYTAEELMQAVKSAKYDDPIHVAFTRMQADTVNLVCKCVREGIDSVDPSIPGGVSIPGWVWSIRFSPETASIMAGKGNRTVGRLPNGLYTENQINIDLASGLLRTTGLNAWYDGRIDIILDESDTYPHNLWSKSAIAMHAKLALSTFCGLKGSKAWYINGTKGALPVSRNYMDILAEHRGYYPALSGIASVTRQRGVMIPLHRQFPIQNVAPTTWGPGRYNPYDENIWADRIFSRLGVPYECTLDFNRDGVYAVAGRHAVQRYTDDELKKLLSRKLLLDAEAARAIAQRGLGEYLGAAITEGELKFTGERDECTGHGMVFPLSAKPPIFTMKPGAEALAYLIRRPYSGATEFTRVAPSVVKYLNSLGGTVIMTAYHMRMGISYQFNEARQRWLWSVLDAFNADLEYITADSQDEIVSVRQGVDGTDYVYVVNLCHDPLKSLRLRRSQQPCFVDLLKPNGTWKRLEFDWRDGVMEVPAELASYREAVLRVR